MAHSHNVLLRVCLSVCPSICLSGCRSGCLFADNHPPPILYIFPYYRLQRITLFSMTLTFTLYSKNIARWRPFSNQPSLQVSVTGNCYRLLLQAIVTSHRLPYMKHLYPLQTGDGLISSVQTKIYLRACVCVFMCLYVLVCVCTCVSL